MQGDDQIQRFDNHVDKLLNYIRYWQASGESIKTSVRVKTWISQLTEEGYYTGGIVPYGYRLENRGRTNKRNKEVCDLAIDPDEAEVVKVIFQKYVCEGYGSQRICRYLAEQYHLQKLENISGKHFTNYVLWMQESGKSASTVKPIWRLFGFFMTR